MSCNFQIIDPTKYDGWDELILSHPEGSFFHASAWARVLSESYNYTPLYFAVINGKQLSALLPVMEVRSFLTGIRGVSLPFTDYCEPIADGDRTFRDLMNEIIEYGRTRAWKCIEVRGGRRLFGEETPPSSSYVGHVINLDEDTEELFYEFKDATRRNIKKADKEGIRVEILNSFESLKAFCPLNGMTRKEHGLPPQPFAFFESLHRHVLSKDHGVVALALYHGRPIAGAVYFHFGKKALYKYGASDRRYQHLRANNLVMWEAIKAYCRKGYDSICLGRTETDNEGLLQFKSGWRPDVCDIHYHKYDLRKRAFVAGSASVRGIHNLFFKNMPMPVLTKVGSLLYRHVG